MRALRVLVLAVLGACFDSDGGETIEDPGFEIFDPLYQRAPHAEVQAPITLDTRSCAYARYTHSSQSYFTFVLVHPLRSKCELWLGATGTSSQYCRFDRAGLVEVELDGAVLRVTDEEAPCVFPHLP
jgi:hypothetical protein